MLNKFNYFIHALKRGDFANNSSYDNEEQLKARL